MNLRQTYVVVELPEELWQPILELRRKYEPWRAKLPVEITLLGSSGTGPIQEGTDRELVIREVERVLAGSAPPIVQFDSINVFPSTGLYHFAIKDSTGLIELHEKLRGVSLPLSQSLFPFTPHCTLCDLSEFDGNREAAIEEILSLSVPGHEIVLRHASIYECETASGYVNKVADVEF